jgi:hypothetical protein
MTGYLPNDKLKQFGVGVIWNVGVKVICCDCAKTLALSMSCVKGTSCVGQVKAAKV